MEKSYWISLSYACYGMIVRNNKVLKTAPIADWMVGKEFDPYIKSWLIRKKAIITEITK